jgi:transcriptional regulator with XRE-family HTH domain
MSGEIQEPKRSNGARGSGALNLAEEARALDMVRAGWTQQRVAAEFGVTKNTIAGLWNRHGKPVELVEPLTLHERLDALHARLDRVLDQTLGVGILAPEPKAGRR